MTNRPVAKLRTPGVLAADLGVPLHRVLYVLRTRTHITPSARAGRLRLYDREAVALIRHELTAIDTRRNMSPFERTYARLTRKAIDARREGGGDV